MIYFIQVITRDILKNEENAVNKEELNNLLENVASGAISPKEAADSIKLESFKDLGFAKVDTNRELRQGMSEVIYGKSKTKEQIAGIVGAMLEEKEKTILITRMSREAADYVAQQYNLNYDELSQIGIIGDMPEKNGKGRIVVATGGTSDIPVAEEAARTAEVYGNEVVRLYDVGVAGMHRLMNHIDAIMNARVIIAIAGMEGYVFNPSMNGVSAFEKYGLKFIYEYRGTADLAEVLKYVEENEGKVTLMTTSDKVKTSFDKKLAKDESSVKYDIVNAKDTHAVLAADKIMFIEECGITRYRDFEKALRQAENFGKEVAGVINIPL